MFKTEEEVLRHFMEGGDVLDTRDNVVYICDIGGEDERFYGIMVADVPPEVAADGTGEAVQWTLGHVPAPGAGCPNRMDFIGYDDWGIGGGFYELTADMLADPKRFSV